MAGDTSPPWPLTTDGKTDWETVFEDPQTGLIALIAQARTAAALRKSTTFVIETIYSREGAPPEIKGFADELERMLPDDLPASELPKVVTAITTVLREIKAERLRREGNDDFDFMDDFEDDEDNDKPKKKKSKKKKKAKDKNPKTRDKRGSRLVIILAIILLLTGLSGGGAYYYFFMMNQGPGMSEKTLQLIEEMKLAAGGNGPEKHVFGWPLTVEHRGGLVGVTANGVPAESCASAAWYFVNRGNIVINDRFPKKIAPSVLKQFCEEKGQTAKLLWLSKPTGETESDGN